MYLWIVYLHIAGAFIFLIAHGASAMVAFKLRGETNLERIRALLDLSSYSITLNYIGLLVILISGIITGFMGGWWGTGWIWASLIILVAIAVLMYIRGSSFYSQLRKLAGLPYFAKNKGQPAEPPASMDEILPLLKSSRPMEISTIGGLGLLILLWLMLFKPF